MARAALMTQINEHYIAPPKDRFKGNLALPIHPMKVQKHIWNNIQSLQWARHATAQCIQKSGKEVEKDGRNDGRKGKKMIGLQSSQLLGACLERSYH